MIQYACPEYFVQVCFDFRLSTFRYYTVNSALAYTTVKPPIKDTPKRTNLPTKDKPKVL